MNILLFQLDGKIPNIALMRLAAHHRDRGDYVELRRASNYTSLEPHIADPAWHQVYGSLIFEKTRPVAERARTIYPTIILGGTGWDSRTSLEAHGVTTLLHVAIDRIDTRRGVRYSLCQRESVRERYERR